MDFNKLEYLLSDDSPDLKKMIDNFMHFPSNYTKIINESKEDEEILLNCMTYALSTNGHINLPEDRESGNIGSNSKKRRLSTTDDELILPQAKRHLSNSNVADFKVISSMPFDYVEDLYSDKTERQFFAELKVTKRTFWRILREIHSTVHFNRDSISGPASTKPEIALEIYFSYLSKKSTFKALSSKFHLCESAIMSSFARCVAAICSLESSYLRWPEDDDVLAAAEEQFDTMGGLPGVLGSLGACCIEMRNIKEPPAGYKIGRQKSIMYLLGVADADGKFIYVQAGYPATFAAQEALESSSLGESLSDPESSLFPSDQFHLVSASKDFIVHQTLLTPYEFAETTTRENFNQRLVDCDTIGRAFVRLKSRFGVFQGQIFSSLEKIPNIIKSCCIVHNFCVDDANDGHLLEPFIEPNSTDYSEFIDDSDFNPLEPTPDAILKRDTIANSLELK